MKISEVTVQDMTDYLRLDDASEIETAEVTAFMTAAKNYIIGYTGLTVEELDEHEDLTVAYQVLVADYFDNRNFQTDKPTYVNRTVQSILSLYRLNLL